ncbi:MAG: phosphonate ABC transporter ATP-binding protein [Spirochaetota bacterium]
MGEKTKTQNDVVQKNKPSAREVLIVEDLKKKYPGGEDALAGVSISVHEEEFVGLIGLSGAGKSTLLRCINRLVEPDDGRVYLDGIEITGLDKKGLKKARRDMGMIFQEFNLVERLTVLQNILTGRLGYVGMGASIFRKFPKKDIERAEELAEVVGMSKYLYKRADKLSGGQRQRVGIARALIQNPKILLVDEPTSSLDPAIGHDVMDEFRRTTKKLGVPTLVSIHDVNLALEYADTIVAMRDGKTIFEGDAKDVTKEKLNEIYQYEI